MFIHMRNVYVYFLIHFVYMFVSDAKSLYSDTPGGVGKFCFEACPQDTWTGAERFQFKHVSSWTTRYASHQRRRCQAVFEYRLSQAGITLGPLNLTAETAQIRHSKVTQKRTPDLEHCTSHQELSQRLSRDLHLAVEPGSYPGFST